MWPTIQYIAQEPEPVAWKTVHKAVCSVIHRGITERHDDITGFGMAADAPDLDAKIRAVVRATDEVSLSRLLARDVAQHGFMPTDWRTRWEHSHIPPVLHDAQEAQSAADVLDGCAAHPNNGASKTT